MYSELPTPKQIFTDPYDYLVRPGNRTQDLTHSKRERYCATEADNSFKMFQHRSASKELSALSMTVHLI